MQTLHIAAATMLSIAGAAFAQENQPTKPEGASGGAPIPAQAPAATPQEPPRVQTQFILRGEHSFETDLKDSAGSVSIDRAGAELDSRIMIGNRSRLSLSLNSEYSWYNFKDATGFANGFSEPWDDTLQTNISATFSTQATKQWSWFVGAGIDDSIQTGATFVDGLTGGIYAGASYAINEHLTIGLGAAIRSRLEDDGQVLPIPVIEWQIADKWRLETTAEIGGRGAALSYQPTEALQFKLSGAYYAREFRLDDSAAAPEGVGRDHRVPIALGVEWHITRQAAVGAHVGVDVYQEYTLLDTDGNKLSQIESKPDVFAGAMFSFSF